ncbi:hypothetical protein GCM10023191_059400 [Actinoallomurus oryzae]|uniref:Elongation factor Tu n=2 Tax=Actinoallomurus oryzae TaxID=502180 RepID=A0ABP8QKG5_9ACTN
MPLTATAALWAQRVRGDHGLMPTQDFHFVVERAFVISGRGAVAVGTLVSGQVTSGDTVCLHTDAGIVRVDDVWVELTGAGTDRLALLFRGLTKEDLLPGTIARSCRD